MKHNHAIFELLKNALKVRKKTYKDLAAHLSISELTVKRMFKDKDCKISRMLEICTFLNVDFYELLAFEERYNNYPQYLPEQIEKALASDPIAFGVFLLIVSNLTTQDLANVTTFSDVELYKVLRKLEKMELIELEANNHFTVKTRLPIAWRLDGHLATALKNVNLRYLSHCFDHHEKPEYNYFSTSRLMSADSAQTMKQKLNELYQSFHQLATQDQLFFEAKELTPYKLQIVHGVLPVDEIFFISE